MANLKQPTIFQNSDEIKHAIENGYLDASYGYLEGEVNANTFPTLIWRYDNHTTSNDLLHQNNIRGEWSVDVVYMRLLTQAIFYQEDIITQDNIKIDVTPNTVERMYSAIKNGNTFMFDLGNLKTVAFVPNIEGV